MRILTVFLYLNSVPDDGGGGTRFTKLDLTVQPVIGTALIWPSTLDEQPDAKDPRTNHQAMPVLNGIKYGANAWIHQRYVGEYSRVRMIVSVEELAFLIVNATNAAHLTSCVLASAFSN